MLHVQNNKRCYRLLNLPYIKGLSETTARIMTYGRMRAFKPGNTLSQQLFRLKDKADSVKMADVIYRFSAKTAPVHISEKLPDC